MASRKLYNFDTDSSDDDDFVLHTHMVAHGQPNEPEPRRPEFQHVRVCLQRLRGVEQPQRQSPEQEQEGEPQSEQEGQPQLQEHPASSLPQYGLGAGRMIVSDPHQEPQPGPSSRYTPPTGDTGTLKRRLETLVECPVCCSVPRAGPIYQCDNGHMLCSTCYDLLENCPVCRQRLPKTRKRRCLLAEQMIEKCQFVLSCLYPGCDFTGEVEALTRHEKNCLSRLVPCPDCSCQKMIAICGILPHLQEKKRIKGAVHDYIVVQKFRLVVAGRQDGVLDWTSTNWPVEIHDFKGQASFFPKCCKQGNVFYAWMSVLGGQEEADKYKVRISIGGLQGTYISHTTGVLPVDKKRVDILRDTHNLMSFSNVQAKQCVDENVVLAVRFQIVRCDNLANI